MKITFEGAAQEVTGSMHLLQVNEKQILLDCGLLQGRRAETNQRNSHLPFDARRLDYMLLSHAHLDHSGNLPTLVRSGYAGQVVTTPATHDLARLMLRDSARIQEQDAEYWNRKHPDEPIQPLYGPEEAERAIRVISTRAYESEIAFENTGVRASFLDAGHILGSAITILDIDESGHKTRLGYTGDLGRKGTLILRDPEPAPQLDYLIIESTYGDRLHPGIEQSEDDLARVVGETARRGGKTVIPAFALERTQEVVYSLHRSILAGKLDPLPIFVDSPLAIDATDVFRLHSEVFDDETKDFLVRHEDPFGFRQLTYTRDVEASKAINQWKGPAVIISANGMVEAGRILHHVKNNIEDERNTILFVGFQAENTLGRRLEDGAKRARIFGEEYTVRAQIARADGFSAHADRGELLDWVRPIAKDLKGLFVVHGEPPAAQSLAEGMRELGAQNVVVPTRGQSIDLTS